VSGLPPRPQPTAEEIAVVTAAVQALSKGSRSEDMADTPAWRFSGRWFATRRFELRRP
jgi:hypothetical protein